MMNASAAADIPEKFPEPELRGDTITPDRYISSAYARREIDKVWLKVWNLGGLAYQAPEPGDWLNCEFGRDAVILVRQDDGRFRAFFNTCPHRGARIVDGPEGHASRFVCPYHGWQFDRGGQVVEVPCPHDYPQGNPCGSLGLKELLCEERFGFVWFNADPQAQSLESFLGDVIVRELSAYRIERMLRVLNMTARADCNWKTITDNFNESYHVQIVHRELAPYIDADGDRCQYDTFAGGHNRGWFPAYRPASFFAADEPVEPLISLIREWDLDPARYRGREQLDQIRIDVQRRKRAVGTERGFKHYAHLKDYQLTDYIIYNLFPNTVITVGPDGVQLLRPRPLGTDPNRCLFDHWWLVPPIDGRSTTPSPAGGPDLPVEDAEHEQIDFGDKSLGVTADQDIGITQVQQEGLNSAGFQGFYLSHQERRVQRFHEVLNDYMRD